jgi:hypothetical protein
MAAAQSQKLEQDSFEGVDDDEWVCYSTYKPKRCYRYQK